MPAHSRARSALAPLVLASLAAALALTWLFAPEDAHAEKPAENTRRSAAPASADRSADAACLTGTLTYSYRDAEAGPDKPLVSAVARNSNWELWGRTSDTEPVRRLSSGITDANSGDFRACYEPTDPDAGPVPELFVRFRSSSTQTWRVVKDRTSTAQYSFDSPTGYDVSGSRDLGTVKVPASMQGAWHVVDTLNELYWKRANPASACWTAHQETGDCDQLTFVWDPASDDGGYWDYPETNYVVLAGDMTDSKHLILHEAGHWFQWQLYDRHFPTVTGCDPHYFEKRSSRTCAWTEGFADAVAAYVLGDYRYVYENGEEFSLVNGPDTPGWDTGDEVQGRVGSSLLDLWAPDGPDGGDWNRDIALMTRQPSEHFREFFLTDRPAATPPLSTTGAARDIIEGHTIRY